MPDHFFIRLFPIVLALTVLILSGCGKHLPARPSGLPQTTPCILRITFGGERIEGVSVLLQSKDVAQKWGAGGTTDADGRAVLKTSGYYDGVVPGEYSVSFQKVGKVELDEHDMPIRSASLIPLKYTAGKSTETVDVTEKQTVYLFNLDGLEPNKTS